MLVLIIGENGSGKSFFMVLMALSELKKNILSNFWIKHPHFRYLEFEDFFNIDDDTDVFIDEAYTWLENRRSNKDTNVYISHMKEQKRKTLSTWYVSEQRWNLIDKRFELNPNLIVECKTRYPINYSTEDFHYKLTYEDLPYPIYKTITYEDAYPFFQYFNTKEKVEPENKQKLEFNIIQHKPKKLMNKVLELVKIIEKDDSILKYTHDSLRWACLKNNIITDYEPFLYLYFQNKIKLEKSKNKQSA